MKIEDAMDVSAIAGEVDDAIASGKQVPPFSDRVTGFDPDAAYGVTAALRARRVARGWKPVGRKIGFSNSRIWDEYGVHAPIWGDMYDATIQIVPADPAHVALGRLPQPRLEPEIALGFATAPEAGMDDAALMDCIGWVAHGFEIVQSIFPGWKVRAADCIADGGLHGLYLLGPRRMIAPAARDAWRAALNGFTLVLSRDGAAVDDGAAHNVLGGPLKAVAHLLAVLANDPHNPPLAAGEIVTTGTVTRAFPVAPGERWSSALSGIDLPGLDVRFR